MENKFINFIFDNYLDEMTTFISQDLSIELEILKDSFIKWKKSKNPKPPKKSTVVVSNEKKGICQFFEEKNNQICGAKIRGGIGTYCSKHKNKKSELKVSGDSGSSNGNIIIQRDAKTKTWGILGTNLVVDSPEKRNVIGMKNNGNVIKLNADAIKECKKLGLKKND